MATTAKMKMSDASMFIGKRLMHNESLMMQTTTDAGSIPFPRQQKHLICSTAQHHLQQLHQANSLRGKLGCSKGRKYWLKLSFRSTRQQTFNTPEDDLMTAAVSSVDYYFRGQLAAGGRKSALGDGVFPEMPKSVLFTGRLTKLKLE